MTRIAQRGVSTVECLMALVVFTIGVLGAAGTLSVATRVEMTGANHARAARWTGNVLDSLRGAIDQAAGNCGSISSGPVRGLPGLSAELVVAPAPGGREVDLALTFPSIARAQEETAWTFLPCR